MVIQGLIRAASKNDILTPRGVSCPVRAETDGGPGRKPRVPFQELAFGSHTPKMMPFRSQKRPTLVANLAFFGRPEDRENTKPALSHHIEHETAGVANAYGGIHGPRPLTNSENFLIRFAVGKIVEGRSNEPE